MFSKLGGGAESSNDAKPAKSRKSMFSLGGFSEYTFTMPVTGDFNKYKGQMSGIFMNLHSNAAALGRAFYMNRTLFKFIYATILLLSALSCTLAALCYKKTLNEGISYDNELYTLERAYNAGRRSHWQLLRNISGLEDILGVREFARTDAQESFEVIVNRRTNIKDKINKIKKTALNKTKVIMSLLAKQTRASAQTNEQVDARGPSIFATNEKFIEVKERFNKIQNFGNSLARAVQTLFAPDCSFWYKKGFDKNGLYNVTIRGRTRMVYCDMKGAGGPWLVIQRRIKEVNATSFDRKNIEYVKGFGKPDKSFWLGLDAISGLTFSYDFELKIIMTDSSNVRSQATYSSFIVQPENYRYKMKVEDFRGSADNALTLNSWTDFTFKGHKHYSCADYQRGSWWWGSCNRQTSNLNGIYTEDKKKKVRSNIYWESSTSKTHKFKPLKYVLMKIKRK